MTMPTTRKMSSRHEQDLVDLLGGAMTRNSGATWSDQADGHQTNSDAHYRFAWDGKSTLAKSVSIHLDTWRKLAQQSRGLLPALPLRWYRDERLTQVDLDLIAVEAKTFAEVVSDANAYRELISEQRHIIELREDGWTMQHPVLDRVEGQTLFDCPYATLTIEGNDGHLGQYSCILIDGTLVLGEQVA